MALLDRASIQSALIRLRELATVDGETIELLIVGGGVMVMEFQSRESTRDLDGIVTNMVDPARIRNYAQVVAVERNWSEIG